MYQLIALFILLITFKVHAQGAQAVTCYEGKKLASAQLLDIYEGKALEMKFPEKLTGNMDDQLKKIMEKLYSTNGVPVFDAQMFYARAEDVQRKFKAINGDIKLSHSPELISIVALEPNCQVETLSNYNEDGSIWIDGNIYNKLSDLDRLALVVHEAIFEEERKFFVPTTTYVRRITALAVSELNLFTPTDWFKSKGIYQCETREYGYTSFAVFKLNDSSKRWRFQFRYLNGHRVFSKKIVDLEFDKDFDPMKFSSDKVVAKGHTFSLVDDDETIKVSSSSSGITIDWKGKRALEKLENQQIFCKKF